MTSDPGLHARDLSERVAQALASGEPLALVPDTGFWNDAAQVLRALAPPGARDLRRIGVIVPAMAHAPALHAALFGAFDGAACIPPRIRTFAQWSGAEGVASRRRTELFEALRGSAWLRERAGGATGALWELARDLDAVLEECVLAAAGDAVAFEARWRAALKGGFSARAQGAGELQSQLILALWRADALGAARVAHLRDMLMRRAREAQGSLVWLVPQGARPWQRSLCTQFTQTSGHPALLVVADPVGLAARAPWLAAAWPEIVAGEGEAPDLRSRARALAARGAVGAGFRILAADSLEEEASAAAAWTLEQLAQGRQRVALVALDRLVARRVRALLERAQVLVADESGWKLSTTSAAAALVGWLDLVISDFGHAELLGWLRSPFTLAYEAQKDALADFIERVLVEAGVEGGGSAQRAALAGAALADAPLKEPAQQLLRALGDAAQAWRRSGPIGRFVVMLDEALGPLGMREPLARDPVGRVVLETVVALREQLAGSATSSTAAEFRALLAQQLEERSMGTRDIASPVRLLNLPASSLRSFDAALLLGADADHLPGQRADSGLMAQPLRRALGLRTVADEVGERTHELAQLLAACPSVAATWRRREGDEPRALSPLLDRLALTIEFAGAARPIELCRRDFVPVAGGVQALATPRAPQLVPARISASAVQDAVDCPYRFFGLHMLRLGERERLEPRPDKREFGRLLHAVLLQFHRPAGTAADAPPALAGVARLHAIIDSASESRLRQRPASIALRMRLHRIAPGYWAWVQAQAQLGWSWREGEVRRERALLLAGGEPVTLVGRLDRIDAGPGAAARIIDYKARDASALKKSLAVPGEDVQLVLYVLLSGIEPEQAAYLALHAPRDWREPEKDVAKLVPVAGDLAGQARALEDRIASMLDRVASGAPLPAHGSEDVCRRCELRGLCRHGFTASAQPDGPAP
jgi:ATP-dependent helicase/nuclease subunit B